MKRRSFIKLSATASAIGLLPNQISNALDLGEKFINCDINNLLNIRTKKIYRGKKSYFKNIFFLTYI